MVDHPLFMATFQDEKALYDAARRGDVSAVRRLLASNVNVSSTPYAEVQCVAAVFYQVSNFCHYLTEWLVSTDDSIPEWTF